MTEQSRTRRVALHGRSAGTPGRRRQRSEKRSALNWHDYVDGALEQLDACRDVIKVARDGGAFAREILYGAATGLLDVAEQLDRASAAVVYRKARASRRGR